MHSLMRQLRFLSFLTVTFLFSTLHSQELLEKATPWHLEYSYDEISDRISCIEGEIPLVFNKKVKAFVDYFAIKDREYTQGVVHRMKLYFPLFAETLKKYGLPEELKYLSIVESGLKPNAVSVANATGLWQFIASTGKAYGLQSDWYIDERMDPAAATDAASRHLRDLYNEFKSWDLAIASYNCGSGNVRKAIRKSGYKRDFWKIYNYLPRETRSYLPQFVAITYLFNHLEEHNIFETDSVVQLVELDTLIINQYLHISTFASNLNKPEDSILLWNPQIKRGAIPANQKDFVLKIPKSWKPLVEEQREFLLDTASKVGKKELDYLARNSPGSTFGRKRIHHRVSRGDVLGTIARQYHVRVSDIKKWNRISGTRIYAGQKIKIWVLPRYSQNSKHLYTASNRLKNANSDNSYIVRRGDSLWSISRDNQVTIKALKSANNLVSNTIWPLQVLVIPN